MTSSSSSKKHSKEKSKISEGSSTNSRLSSEDPRCSTLNYEYQEQPTVKLNLSPSELEFLDDDNKSMLSQSSASSMSVMNERPDRNGNRFLASVAVLISLGLMNVGLNALYSKTNLCLSLIIIFFSIMVYEWNRIHAITLTRKLRPVLNMASVFATYKHLDIDKNYGAEKDKYYKWACCNVPEINTELPRTSDEKSPPQSPPNSKKADTVKPPKPEKTQKSDSKSSHPH